MIIQPKDKDERFYMLRKEIIGASCKEVKEKRINVRKFVLNTLELDGFKKGDKGTEYLATLITILYHERKMLEYMDDRSYWDLSDLLNEHYSMLGDTKENVISIINKSINKNELDDGPLENIAYQIADYTNYHFNKNEKVLRYW